MSLFNLATLMPCTFWLEIFRSPCRLIPKLLYGVLEVWRMIYVYILTSISHLQQRYFGITENLKQRLEYHNTGKCQHTSKFVPWRLETYVAFSDKAKGVAFEKYIKTGSGREFSRRRF